MNSGGGSSSCLNEVQFPKELQRFAPRSVMGAWTGLNEVQFPKELQLSPAPMPSRVRRPQ